MFYKSYPRKVLKFKDLYKENYEVDVCYDDMVIDIKKRLSINIKKDYKNILFMFKNEILFDDKLISDYNIERSQFVLWFEGEDCARYSGGDLDIIKCITIIDNHNNDYEYFVNMNKLSTVRMLKSIIANKYGLNDEEFYLEFNKNNLSIDENCKSLEQFGLSNGCRIELITEKVTKHKLKYIIDRPRIYAYAASLPDVVLVPLTNGYEIDASTDCHLRDLKNKIRTKCKTRRSSIKLYSDADKIHKIKKNRDLQRFYNKDFHRNKILIYYEIFSE